MGTSKRYGGSSSTNPIVPSWLQMSDNPSKLPEDGQQAGPERIDPDQSNQDQAEHSRPPIPPSGPSGRFKSSRQNFNRYASTRETQYIRKALSGYVRKGTGGKTGASQRMGPSKRTAGKILQFINVARKEGTAQALANLGLENLIGQSPESALSALTETFCPPGGLIDDSIAREAWDEAVLSITEQGIEDIIQMTPDQWQTLFTDFVINSIELRVFNDIGLKGISLPGDIQAVNQIQDDLREIIYGAVTDAIGDRFTTGNHISQGDFQKITNDIYENAFEYLKELEEE